MYTVCSLHVIELDICENESCKMAFRKFKKLAWIIWADRKGMAHYCRSRKREVQGKGEKWAAFEINIIFFKLEITQLELYNAPG